MSFVFKGYFAFEKSITQDIKHPTTEKPTQITTRASKLLAYMMGKSFSVIPEYLANSVYMPANGCVFLLVVINKIDLVKKSEFINV